MIGILPKTLEVCGSTFPIRSDFRIALLVFQAYNDPDLSDCEKMEVCVRCLFERIPADTYAAIKSAVWFLDGGNTTTLKAQDVKLLDWEQDESILFPAVNKVAGMEIRAVDYMHWWTFLGLFNEIGEGLFSTVVSLRNKKMKGKPLEKWEQEFYKEHRDMVDLKTRYSKEEREEMERLNRLLG